MQPITLTCWDCGTAWAHDRRRGVYPTRCPDCRISEDQARRLARRARASGLHLARAIRHAQHGWVCIVPTPWHEQPALLRDQYDIPYVIAELGTPTLAVAA